MGTTADIRGAVYEALKADPAIHPDDIDIKVMGGDVLFRTGWRDGLVTTATMARRSS